MLELNLDHSTIVATVLANIILSISIQIQKYAKRKIIHLALHGSESLSFKHMWKAGVSLLVATECCYFVTYGVSSSALVISPLGVFTIMSNIVVPPLLYESHEHTFNGSLLSQIGILIMTLEGSYTQEVTEPKFNWDLKITKALVAVELLLGIVFIMIRACKPSNCSIKLVADCGISSLMGCHVVTALEIVNIGSISEFWMSALAMIVIIGFVLEMAILSSTLDFFSAFQVVPHHFALFMSINFFNSYFIFGEFQNSAACRGILLGIAHILMIAGVWIAAKPHEDIPISVATSGRLMQLRERVLSRLDRLLTSASGDEANCANCALDTEWGYNRLCEEYCGILEGQDQPLESTGA